MIEAPVLGSVYAFACKVIDFDNIMKVCYSDSTDSTGGAEIPIAVTIDICDIKALDMALQKQSFVRGINAAF
ncbi:MAG: hypothetical protein II485_02305 [Firmicutes bacterium]|nr:hypothetical protein [Bacillota bacterium]